MMDYDDASRGTQVNSVLESLKRRLADPKVPIAGTALLVAVAYYLGSRFGSLLRLPPIATSIMWPPNAMLTATWLLPPPRHWRIYLLAALPAHLAAQIPQHVFSLPFILVVFATNCSEALIAALLIRRFAPRGRITFDSLRSAGTFILCAGLAAPFFSSFLDAGAVTLLRGDRYD